MNALLKGGEPVVVAVKLEGVFLTSHAWLVSEHPREVMVYGRSALSSALKSQTVIDSEEYLDNLCAGVGKKLSEAFGHTYTVDLLDAETQGAVCSISEPVVLRVHAETNLSVTKQ